jgi:predicted dehydrogenase
MLAGNPNTRLAGVWARRPEAARELAAAHGATAFDSLDAMFAASEAVAFAVPPDVQADLAVRAARAGKHLLLEKPIAGDVAGAEALVEAIDRAGVRSMVLLTWRYAGAVRSFLAETAVFRPFGGRALFVSGAFLGGHFATPWRLARGALVDLGPHVIDLLDAALGRVTAVDATGACSVGSRSTSVTRGAPSRRRRCAPPCRSTPSGPASTSTAPPAASTSTAPPPSGRRPSSPWPTSWRQWSAPASPIPSTRFRGLHLQRIIGQAEDQLRVATA